MRKPAALAYSVDERPPLFVVVILALQHVGVIAVNLVYPLLLAREAGLSTEAATDMLGIGMGALAVGVLLQAIPRGPIGCHYLAPMVYASPYLAPGFLAIQIGGLPLFWGMTIVAGAATLVFASIWDRMRVFIPPETAGLVVFLIGATIGIAALRQLHHDDGSVGTADAAITVLALSVMIALNVWGKGRLRLFSILIGIVAGYVASLATGVMPASQLASLANQPLFAVPHFGHMAWSFDATLIVPFVVTALAVAMATTAIVTTYQRITDADWARPEMRSISAGIRGDGLSTIVAGLFCTFGLAVGPANAGLVAATGIASRAIAYPIAAILLLAAVQPGLAGLLTIMPVPAMVAGLLFPATFIMINGVQIIASRVIDARRTLVIGAGILSFLLVAVFPRTFAGAPAWLQPVVGSPLVLATIIALALNLIFRIGIKRSVRMQIVPAELRLEDVESFVERNAGGWGARTDAVVRLKNALRYAIEAVIGHSDKRNPISLELTYDELDIDAKLSYRGDSLEWIDQAPSVDQIIEDDGHVRLAVFLVKRQADKVETMVQNGLCVLRLHFRQ
jgi:xanthine permease XanP